MPVARILTRFSEDATALSGQLQSLGYTVEIAAPDEPRNTHADLEINLDRCPAGAAFSRAEQLAHAAGADVFVAPGIFAAGQGRGRNEHNQQPPLAKPPAVDGPQPGPSRTAPAAMNATPAPPSASQSEPRQHAESLQGRDQPAATRDFAFLGSYAPGRGSAADQSHRERKPSPNLGGIFAATVTSAAATVAALNKKFAETREQKRIQRELTREARERQLSERRAQAAAAALERQVAAEERAVAARQEEAVRRQREAVLAAQAAQARQEAEIQRRAEAEMRARAQAETRVRAQAEAQARAQAEAHAGTRAAQADAARIEAARAEASNIAAPRTITPADIAAPQPTSVLGKTVNRDPANMHAGAPSVLARLSYRRSAVAASRVSGKSRTLLAAAALAVAAMVGWTIALQHQPVSSLPFSSNSTLEQELPFGPVKLVPRNDAKAAVPPHRTGAPAGVAVPPKAAPTAQSSTARMQTAAPAPTQPVAKKPSPAIRPRASQATTRRRFRPTDAEIADDEVIVHHYGPTAPPKTVVSKTGPRRISDLD